MWSNESVHDRIEDNVQEMMEANIEFDHIGVLKNMGLILTDLMEIAAFHYSDNTKAGQITAKFHSLMHDLAEEICAHQQIMITPARNDSEFSRVL
jgi:hypothetical protein